MKINVYFTFLISGLNCSSISKRHATNEIKQLKNYQLEVPPPCEKNVIARCKMENHKFVKDKEGCKRDGFRYYC